MEEYFVIVAGGGETSRANLEALMEDHYYANGVKGTLVLPYVESPSQAQVFAAQYAKDKSKEILVFNNGSGNFGGLPAADFVVDPNPFKKAVDSLKGKKAVAFLLWNDEDPTSQDFLAICSKESIPCFDLTDGLTAITATTGLKPQQEVIFPIQELNLPAEEFEEEAEEEEEDEDEEEEEEEQEDEDQLMEDIYNGVLAIANLFARVMASHISKDKDA
jgi:hypothetical protein